MSLEVKDTFFSKKKALNVRGNIWTLDSPVVMGILNLTPDSFYDGGKYDSLGATLKKATELYALGAKIIDLGASSSRPGASPVSEEEEWGRLSKVLIELKKEFPQGYISVDTCRSEIARRSLDLGADIINDISGGQRDAEIIRVAAQQQAPYIAMHMRGDPASMQELTSYDNLFNEVLDYFIRLDKKANEEGLTDLMLDPGFGFAKTTDQNYELLNQLELFKVLERVVVVGLSRKSMIYKTLGTQAEQALNGTTALHMSGLMNGADILRVHDVKEAIESITLFNKLSR